MSSFAVCLNAVLPLFLVMGLGYIARCTGAISRTDVPKINKWAFKFFMPVMLFYNIYTSDLSAAVRVGGRHDRQGGKPAYAVSARCVF